MGTAKNYTKINIDKYSHYKNMFFTGGVAQLGERLNGIQEVRGSIPLVSRFPSFPFIY